jgi:hypothetical protein
MKKTNTIFILLLLFTTSLWAQGKLKKETTVFPQYKKIALFDKNSKKLLCSESWDSTRLLTSFKSITYSKNTFQYDAQNRIIVYEWINVLFDADGKKRSLNRILSKTKYGNPIVYTILHWNSENILVDSTRKEEKYTPDNLMLESSTTKWKAKKPATFLSEKCMFEYNAARCLVSSKYFQYDSLQQETGFSKRYYTRTSDCYADTYVHVLKNELALGDTIIVSKITYKNNRKDVFTRSIFGFVNFCYEQSDSVHVIQNDDGQLVSEKNWWSNEHLFKDYTYLKNGKLDVVYTDFVESKASGKQIDFYHYDAFDSLVLLERYPVIKGKIDSACVNTLREIIYERDNANRFSKITNYNNISGGSTITYFEYDCNNQVKQKNISDFHRMTYTQFEYFDDPCDDAPIVENTVLVYPNPAQNILNIEANENQKLQKIDIYNLQGRLIQSFIVNDCNTYTALNISVLHNGIYVIQSVFDNGKTATQRFVKY